jgi:ribonuclease PH
VNRSDGRLSDQIRPISFELNIAPHADGSVLVRMGNTRVICGVTVEENVPRWMKEQGVTGGWLTAEYSMLPYSTQTRKPRDVAKGRVDGRSAEIQRLIGRSLRALVDLEKLGPRTVWVDCDVLQADGGTRTAAIMGASLAVAMACRKLARDKKVDVPPVRKLVAAVSAGVLDGEALVDLSYEEGQTCHGRFQSCGDRRWRIRRSTRLRRGSDLCAIITGRNAPARSQRHCRINCGAAGRARAIDGNTTDELNHLLPR